MADKLSANEQQAIEQYDGPVERPVPKQPKSATAVDWDGIAKNRQASKIIPKTWITLPSEMSVRAALEWAFATEKAQIDYDEIGAVSGGHRRGMSVEALLEDRHQLGGVAIDTSPGRSLPAEDAEVIASVVRATLPFYQAVWLAHLARARREPDWMRDATPHFRPVDWVWGRGGKRGRTADAAQLGVEGWRPIKRRNKKNILVEEKIMFTPLVVAPTAKQIAAARREYLDWYSCLLTMQIALRNAGLRRFTINRDMPPLRPWRSGN